VVRRRPAVGICQRFGSNQRVGGGQLVLGGQWVGGGQRVSDVNVAVCWFVKAACVSGVQVQRSSIYTRDSGLRQWVLGVVKTAGTS
jgi:hypothetical protein